MSDKQTVKFGDICREVKLTTKDPIADGYERYIGLEHLDSGSLKIKRWGMIAEDNPSFTRVFKKGHILFGKRRPYLKKAAIAEFDGVCSGDIIVLEVQKSEKMARLTPYIIHSDSFWDWAVKNSSGSLSPRTKFSSLSKFQIPTMNSEEIERFNKTLTVVTDAEQKNEKVRESLNNLLETLVTDISKVQKNGFSSLKTLEVTITAGKSPKATERPPKNNEFGVLKVSSITSGKFAPQESKTLDVNHVYGDKLLVKKGDLLISRANGNPDLVGVCCIVDKLDLNNLYLSDKTLRLNCAPKLREFIKCFINSSLGRKQVAQLWSGSSGQKNISQEKVLSIELPTISDDRLVLFNETYKQIENSFLMLQERQSKLAVIKNALTGSLLRD